METVLSLLKIDLGITHTLRDVYFNAQLEACNAELSRKGIKLDLTNVEDQILLSDYTVWKYRNRMDNIPISQNLQWRIRNRIVKERSKYGTT